MALHYLRSGPYPHRPGDEVNFPVTGQQLRVEVETTVVVANHKVASLWMDVAKRRFVHAPSCKEKEKAGSAVLLYKGLFHYSLVIC